MIKENPRGYRGFIVNKYYLFPVRPTGFEPVTLCSGGIRSNPAELRAHTSECVAVILEIKKILWLLCIKIKIIGILIYDYFFKSP